MSQDLAAEQNPIVSRQGGSQMETRWSRFKSNVAGLVILALASFGPAGAAAQTAKEVREVILKDIRDKERAVKAEQEKLRSLTREARSLNPTSRLDEVSRKAEQQTADRTRAALEQFRTGPITNPIEAAESIERGLDAVRDFQALYEAMGVAADEVIRQQELSSEIPTQERKLQKAKVELGVAKGAASVVLPLLEAIEEAERIEQKRKQLAESHARGDAEATRQHQRSLRSSTPGPAMNYDPSTPIPGRTLPPTRSGQSQSTTRPAASPAAPPPARQTPPPPPPVDMPRT